MGFEFEISILCDAILLAFMVVIFGFLMDMKMQTQENNEEIHQLIENQHKCPYAKEGE